MQVYVTLVCIYEEVLHDMAHGNKSDSWSYNHFVLGDECQ